MEGEAGEIRQAACFPAVIGSAEPVGAVGQYDYPAKGLLYFIGGSEERPFPFHDLIYPVIIAGYAGDIHRNNRLGLFSDCRLQLVIIHMVTTRRGVHQLQRCADMTDHAGGSRVGIGAGDDLVTRTDAKHMKRQLHGRRRGIQANRPVCSAVGGDFFFKQLGLRAGRDPAGTQNLHDLVNLQLSDVGRRKIHFMRCICFTQSILFAILAVFETH